MLLQVALKFEPFGVRHPQVRHEYKVYRELKGIPWFATVCLINC